MYELMVATIPRQGILYATLTVLPNKSFGEKKQHLNLFIFCDPHQIK